MSSKSRYFTDDQKALLANLKGVLAEVYQYAHGVIKHRNPHIDQDCALGFFGNFAKGGATIYEDGKPTTPEAMMDGLRKNREDLPEELRILVPKGRVYSDDGEATTALVGQLVGLAVAAEDVQKYRLASLPESPAADKEDMRKAYIQKQEMFKKLYAKASTELSRDKPLMTVITAIANIALTDDLSKMATATTEAQRKALAETAVLDAAQQLRR